MMYCLFVKRNGEIYQRFSSNRTAIEDMFIGAERSEDIYSFIQIGEVGGVVFKRSVL